MHSVVCRPHILTQPRMQPVSRRRVRKQSAKQLRRKESTVPTHQYKPLKFKVHERCLSTYHSAIIIPKRPALQALIARKAQTSMVDQDGDITFDSVRLPLAETSQHTLHFSGNIAAYSPL